MKQTRRIVALLLALMTLLATFPFTALATPKVKTLKMNTWYAMQNPAGSWNAYKLTLNAESVVYVSWKNVSSKSTFAEVDFCEDVDCSYVHAGRELYVPASGRDGFVLYPGTYYVGIFNVVKGAKVKFSAVKAYTLKKTNTTRAKAISLSSGKKAEIVIDRKNKVARWYKLKLTKKQALSLYINRSHYFNNCELTLYNSKLKKVALKEDWDKQRCVSKSKLAKGTYYVKVTADSDLYPDCGAYCQLYWK